MKDQYPEQPSPEEFRNKAVNTAQGAEFDALIAEREADIAEQESFDSYMASRPYRDGRKILDADGNSMPGVLTGVGFRRSNKHQALHRRDASHMVGDGSNSDTLQDEITQLNYAVTRARQKSGDAEDALLANYGPILHEKRKELYGSMGILEVTRNLAEAELETDADKQAAIRDVLEEKWLAEAIKFFSATDTSKDPEATPDNRADNLWNRLMEYKESHKENLIKKGNHQDQAAERIDWDYVDQTRAYLHQEGADASEIMRDIPAEAELRDKSNDERFTLMPDSYKQVVEGDPDLTRNRIDKNELEFWVNAFHSDGMPIELIDEIPASFFYSFDDPEFSDELPQSIQEWLDHHPDAEVNSLLARDDGNPAPSPNAHDGESVLPPRVPTPQTTQKKSRRERLKNFLKAEGAVSFDKYGYASVDTERGGIDLKKALAIGLGTVALAGLANLAGRTFGSNSENHDTMAIETITAPDGVPPQMDLSLIPQTELPGGPDLPPPHLIDPELSRGDSLREISQSQSTVWALAENILNGSGTPNPDNMHIQAETQRILDLNGLDWDTARNVVTGQKLKV